MMRFSYNEVQLQRGKRKEETRNVDANTKLYSKTNLLADVLLISSYVNLRRK
jgi:hypothetical protein